MAVTIPAALFLVNAVYLPRAKQGLVRRALAALHEPGVYAVAGVTAAVIGTKLFTHNPLSDDPRYAGRSFKNALDAMRAFHEFLLYRDHPLPVIGLLIMWAIMATLAFAIQSRPMKFGLCFLVVSLIPVCLIEPRGGYMLYVPLIGWALCTSSLFVNLQAPLHRIMSDRSVKSLGMAMAAVAVAFIIWIHGTRNQHLFSDIHHEQDATRRVIDDIKNLHPQLRPTSYLLIVNDSVEPGRKLLFLMRLAYGDPTLLLDRTEMMSLSPAKAEMTLYDYIFADIDGHMREISAFSHGTDVSGESPVRVQFVPPRVRPGATYSVVIPSYAGSKIDVSVRVTRHDRKDSAYIAVVPGWCTLSSQGVARLDVPPGLSDVAISIRRIRTGEGVWALAEGEIEVGR